MCKHTLEKGGNNEGKKLVLCILKKLSTRKSEEMAEQINRDYAGKTVHLICVLKGSIFFAVNLQKRLTVPVTLDFMSASSYGNATKSSGKLKINKDLDEDINGLHCIIVEDIVDSGRTLSMVKKMLEGRNPASLKLCTLLDKPDRRERQMFMWTIRDLRFRINSWLDLDLIMLRNIEIFPYIGVLDFIEGIK